MSLYILSKSNEMFTGLVNIEKKEHIKCKETQNNKTYISCIIILSLIFNILIR
jgi:hypothetical protein